MGLLMALTCRFTLGAVAEVWHHNPALGVAVGSAMAAAIVVASFMGTLVPIIFKRLGVDPAVAAGPFVTTTNRLFGPITIALPKVRTQSGGENGSIGGKRKHEKLGNCFNPACRNGWGFS